MTHQLSCSGRSMIMIMMFIIITNHMSICTYLILHYISRTCRYFMFIQNFVCNYLSYNSFYTIYVNIYLRIIFLLCMLLFLCIIMYTNICAYLISRPKTYVVVIQVNKFLNESEMKINLIAVLASSEHARMTTCMRIQPMDDTPIPRPTTSLIYIYSFKHYIFLETTPNVFINIIYPGIGISTSEFFILHGNLVRSVSCPDT